MTALANLTPNRSHDVIDRPRPQFKYLVGGTLQLASFLDSVQEVPTAASAFITIQRPGGAACTTPVTLAAAAIDANGTMSYALTGANCDMMPAFGNAYSPWTANWKYTVGGVVYQKLTVFDVVLWPLFNVVRQTDLQVHVPDLTDTLFTTEGTSAQAYVSEAFEDVMRRLENNGNRPWLVLDSEQLRRPVEYLALAKFFDTKWQDKGDRWFARYETFLKRYEDWFANTKFIYNQTQTGYSTPGEVNRPINDPYFRI